MNCERDDCGCFRTKWGTNRVHVFLVDELWTWWLWLFQDQVGNKQSACVFSGWIVSVMTVAVSGPSGEQTECMCFYWMNCERDDCGCFRTKWGTNRVHVFLLDELWTWWLWLFQDQVGNKQSACVFSGWIVNVMTVAVSGPSGEQTECMCFYWMNCERDDCGCFRTKWGTNRVHVFLVDELWTWWLWLFQDQVGNKQSACVFSGWIVNVMTVAVSGPSGEQTECMCFYWINCERDDCGCFRTKWGTNRVHVFLLD